MVGDQARGERFKSWKAPLKTFIYGHPILLSLYRTFRFLQWLLLRYPFWVADEWFFCWRTGLQRDPGQSLDNLTVRGPNKLDATSYGPVHPKFLSRALSTLPIDHTEYVFVDFGSGKGRAVLMASRYPFKRIIGIEFAKELIEAALKNLSLWRPEKKCGSIELLWADALEFEIPESPCVLYFGHPFGAVMLSRVLEKARETLKTCPRDMIILYLNPEHHEAILALFDAEVLSRSKRYRYAAYRMRPPG